MKTSATLCVTSWGESLTTANICRCSEKVRQLFLDIGEVEQGDSDSEFEHVNSEISEVQIIGVLQLDTYKECLQCKARVEPLALPLGKCSKADCAMMQRYDLCTNQLSAKLLVLHNSTVSAK